MDYNAHDIGHHARAFVLFLVLFSCFVALFLSSLLSFPYSRVVTCFYEHVGCVWFLLAFHFCVYGPLTGSHAAPPLAVVVIIVLFFSGMLESVRLLLYFLACPFVGSTSRALPSFFFDPFFL